MTAKRDLFLGGTLNSGATVILTFELGGCAKVAFFFFCKAFMRFLWDRRNEFLTVETEFFFFVDSLISIKTFGLGLKGYF